MGNAEVVSLHQEGERPLLHVKHHLELVRHLGGILKNCQSPVRNVKRYSITCAECKKIVNHSEECTKIVNHLCGMSKNCQSPVRNVKNCQYLYSQVSEFSGNFRHWRKTTFLGPFQCWNVKGTLNVDSKFRNTYKNIGVLKYIFYW